MRRGMMLGSGKRGYYNVIGRDPYVHSQSAKGMKQPQRMPVMLKKGENVTSKFTGVRGRVLSKQPFAVEYDYEGKKHRKLSSPKYWKGGKKWKSIYDAPIAQIEKDFKKTYGRKPTSDELNDIVLEGQWGGKLATRFTNFNVYRVGKTPPKGSKIRIQDIGRKGHSLRMAYYKDGKWHTYQFLISKADAASAKAQKLVAEIKSKYPNVRGGKDMPVTEIDEFIAKQTKPSLLQRGTQYLKKIKKEKEERRIKELAHVRPEFEKLQKQQSRVETLKSQIATQEDKGMDTNKEIEELEEEMEQLRELQEKATNINVKDLSNAELKTLAVRDNNDSFLADFLGSGANEFEAELLRRVKKERIIDKEIKQAQTEPLEEGGFL